MAKTTEKGSKARAQEKPQEKPQPKPHRGAMKEVMKEMKAAPMKKQAPRGAMKEAALKQSKDASKVAAYVNKQISQLSRGNAVVSGR